MYLLHIPLVLFCVGGIEVIRVYSLDLVMSCDQLEGWSALCQSRDQIRPRGCPLINHSVSDSIHIIISARHP